MPGGRCPLLDRNRSCLWWALPTHFGFKDGRVRPGAHHRLREIARLRKRYGRGRWRKRKGIADVRLGDGEIERAEVHWYEATGIGKREFKIKRLL